MYQSISYNVCVPCFIDEFSRRQKVRAINRALFTDPFDITTLKQLAISRGGLLSDELRCKAWPKLLQIDVDNIPEKPGEDWKIYFSIYSRWVNLHAWHDMHLTSAITSNAFDSM